MESERNPGDHIDPLRFNKKSSPTHQSSNIRTNPGNHRSSPNQTPTRETGKANSFSTFTLGIATSGASPAPSRGETGERPNHAEGDDYRAGIWLAGGGFLGREWWNKMESSRGDAVAGGDDVGGDDDGGY
ncbi:hypothetical protein GUJ93_ZPchr0011g27942 [Zizania palustris]|uniref:Uncharacterized protein n=1 Tax=Zizania palustris TaxID=103762 RepID=A0A8J6BTS5_ZIZPA|nr:hypothetical protein GUJ93_ZPchr0011g27942 [Zizania palustris]